MFLRPRKPSRKFWMRFGLWRLKRMKRRRNLGRVLIRPYPHVLHPLLRLHNLFLHQLRFQQKLVTLMMMMMMRRRVYWEFMFLPKKLCPYDLGPHEKIYIHPSFCFRRLVKLLAEMRRGDCLRMVRS